VRDAASSTADRYWAEALTLVAGCGGQGQAGTSTSTSDSSSGPAKSQFIKQADKICAHADRRQLQLRGVYLSKHPNGEKTSAGQVVTVKEAILPPMSEELADLSALPLPATGGEEVEAMLGELEAGIKEAEADPKAIVEGEWPLRKVEKRLKKFGFVACAAPG
jgi:hypothetical protein